MKNNLPEKKLGFSSSHRYALGLMQNRGLICSDGFTLIEILFGLVILSVGLLALATMQISSINGNATAYDFSESTVHAQTQIETLMAMDYADVVDGASIIDGYSLQWTVTSEQDFNGDGTNDAKEITITVDDPQGNRRITLDFLKTAMFD